MERRRANPTEFFLVIGNGRTGSTWLQTTLDQLPDVRARLEIKLRLVYQDPHPMHVYVDRSTRSIKDCILQACDADSLTRDKRPIFGSKLIFDPYGYLDPDTFDFLEEIIGGDVPIIFLKRNYAAQFFSWKVRGVFHRLNPVALSRLHDFDREFVAAVSQLWRDQAEPRLQRIVLTQEGRSLAGAPRDADGEGVVYYPLEDAVEDLLVLFYNDLMTLSLARRSRRHIAVDYSEIESRLPEVARFLGSAASEAQVRTALRQPITDRLRPIGSDFVQPSGILESFSDCLEQALNDAAADGVPDRFWRWHHGRDWIELAMPRFEQLLNRHGLPGKPTTTSARGISPGSVLWQRRRSVYTLQ